MQRLIRLLFVDFEVAGWMESDGATLPALAPDAQRDLLGHRAAGHKDGGLFAQQAGNLLLKPLDQFALAVTVGLLIGIDRLGQRRQCRLRALRPMSAEEALATIIDGAPLGLRGWWRVGLGMFRYSQVL